MCVCVCSCVCHRLDLEDGVCAVSDDTEREALREIISNSRLAEYYLSLARDLDVMEPKLPEDVYKSHLVRTCRLFTRVFQRLVRTHWHAHVRLWSCRCLCRHSQHRPPRHAADQRCVLCTVQ